MKILLDWDPKDIQVGDGRVFWVMWYIHSMCTSLMAGRSMVYKNWEHKQERVMLNENRVHERAETVKLEV